MSKIGKHIRDLIRRQVVKKGRVDGYSLLELIVVIMLGTVAMPALTGMFTQVFANSHRSEIMTMAKLLAIEQLEIIMADRAGTGAGYGYAAILGTKYADVQPTGIYSGYLRTVAVRDSVHSGHKLHKRVRVWVGHHYFSASVRIVTHISDYPGLP